MKVNDPCSHVLREVAAYLATQEFSVEVHVLLGKVRDVLPQENQFYMLVTDKGQASAPKLDLSEYEDE